MTAKSKSHEFIRWFDEIDMKDISLVGGKTASLGELTQNLAGKGIRVPSGFGVTAQAYRCFLDENNLVDIIRHQLQGLDANDTSALQQAGQIVRQKFLNAEIPANIQSEILEAYDELAHKRAKQTRPSSDLPQSVSVAVRSSATAEDLPDASFAGQQDSFLNVNGHGELLDACKRCFASLFNDRAISYRQSRDFDHLNVALSLCIQQMVRSDLASSGVMFTIDTESGFKDAVLINASWGLGESIVQGSVNPDEFVLFKPTLLEGKQPILQRHMGSKETKLIYDTDGARMTRTVKVSGTDRRRLCISDDEALQLARWACVIEEHYSQVHKKPTPMDIEWGKDGETGELYILQARPETVKSRLQSDANQLTVYRLQEKGKELIRGRAVGEKVATGTVRVISTVEKLEELREGEILVTDRTDPDWEPFMKKASAVITNRGGRTCHAAIVSRELGLPAVVGTERATSTLKEGETVTLSCAEGEVGRVYEGALAYQKEQIDISSLQVRPKTKIMLNLANPEAAFRLSMIPNDGIGLARVEFIINHMIKVHPMALVHFDRVQNTETRQVIEELTRGHSDKESYFVDSLAEGVGTLAAAFYPKDVIVRMSDFKSNEYANLVGGTEFEPQEENPMIGFRGASRYDHKRYREGFALECRAMKKVRDTMGLTNLKLMIPFCRTLNEGKRVLDAMAKNGLKRGENGLEVYVMCEIPSNVILAEEFAKIFDGFSIGSNDLTQLVLGVDRDSELLADIFDERNEAVKSMISQVIDKAKKAGSKIGICGQAPSDYPEFAHFLVDKGIDSISLNPDSLIKTTLSIGKQEAK